MASHERIGSALNSGNLRSDEIHTDVDVVGALGFANRLGAELQHLCSAGQLSSFSRAVALLADTTRRSMRRKKMGISAVDAAKVSCQALKEWLVRACYVCNGTGEVLLNYRGEEGQKGRCPSCNGTGLYIPTWHERRHHMGLGADEESGWWEKRVDLAKEIAEDAYRSAKARVSFEMKLFDKDA